MDDARIVEILLSAVLAIGIGFGAWICVSVVNIKEGATRNGERIARLARTSPAAAWHRRDATRRRRPKPDQQGKNLSDK